MKNNKILCGLIFAAMFLFLQMQFHQVMVYFDDYGYYSLSYGVEPTSGGHVFSFAELISYLKVHYFQVNGRLPGYMLWLSLYIIGGLSLVQMAAATFVTLILIVIWKFIDSKSHPILSALLVCSFYGLISLEMHHQGTYWFAAFFQYVAPVFAIVLFVKLYFRYREEGLSWKQIICLSLLVFLAGYSQEQLGVTVAFMMLLILAYETLNRKLKMYNFMFLGVAFLAVAALLLSPSSQNRASNSGYTFIETIIYSTYKVIRTFFAADISVLVILLYFAVFMFSLSMLKKDKHFFKLMDIGGILLSLISIFVYLCRPVLNLLDVIMYNRYYLLIVVGVPCVAVIAIQIMRYYWTRKEDSRLILFMTAVGSVGCLCFVPEVPPRLFLSSWLLLFPLLADGLFTCNVHFKSSRAYDDNRILCLICSVLVILSCINLVQIYRGYSANAEIYRYNDEQLVLASESEKAGSPMDKVFLRTYVDPNCAAALVYNEEVTFMKYWMKSYYDFESIPDLYFNQTGTADDSGTYIDQGNQVFLEIR